MRVMTLKKNLRNPSEVEVHLELLETFRAVSWPVLWYGMAVLVGMLIYRAYILIFG